MTKRIITPFANTGDKNVIPDTAPPTDNGYANYPNGFPPSNSINPALGGSYVKRSDINGVLNDISGILSDQAKGLIYTFDAAYATAISGYPVGAILRKASQGGFWQNVTAANANNPDTGGAGWVSIDPRMYADAGGTATAYTATYSPAITTLSDGHPLELDIAAVGTNTTTTPTLSVNGLTPWTIVKNGGTALQIGDMPTRCLLRPDIANTRFILLNPVYGNISQSIVTAGGTPNALTATSSATSYTDGMRLLVKATAYNTAKAVTINVNSLGNKTIYSRTSAALRVLDIAGAGHILDLIYDATLGGFVLQNPNPDNSVPVGTIIDWTGVGTKLGWAVPDGSNNLLRANYVDLWDLFNPANLGFTSQTFTVTIASPCVVTKSTHGLTQGDMVRLSTTGALPTGLTNGGEYYVDVIDTNTFYLCSSPLCGQGTRINTSGSQSGTHSYLKTIVSLGDGSTTFGLPSLKGMVRRTIDASGTIDIARTVNSWQKGTLGIMDTDWQSTPAVITLSSINTTTANAQKIIGMDAYNINNYALTSASPADLAYLNPTASLVGQTLANLTGGTVGILGVQRMTNAAVNTLIKVY